MSKRDASNRKTTGQSPDPYLRSFLRQAVAIIAAERGLNDASRAKLRALASQLGLTDSTYRSALEKLKLRNATLGLNRYERRFVEFLSVEFEKMSGDILTIKSENKVIDLAQRKYQISEVRAHQLIRKTAAEFGVGTISHHDAELFATSLIDDAVGDQTWLREEDKQRLLNACQKWGMTPEEIEFAIKVRFARNRRQRNKSIASSVIAAIGIVSLFIAVIFGVNQLDWESIAGKFNQSANVQPIDKPVETSLPFPEWFDDNLSSQMQKAIASDRKLAQFQTPDFWQPERRGSTYAQLTDIAFAYSKPNKALNEFICSLYFADPDPETAAEILSLAKNALSIFDDQLISTRQLREAFSANGLIGSLVTNRKSPAERPSDKSRDLFALASELSGLPPTSPSFEMYDRESKASLLDKAWRNALQHAASGRQVVILLQELEKRTSKEPDSPAINEIRSNLIFQLIENGVGWNQVRPSIVASIRQSDLTTSNLWIDSLDLNSESEFSGFAARELASRLNLDRDQSYETLLRELQKLRSTNRFRAYSTKIETGSTVDDTVRRVEVMLEDVAQPYFDHLDQTDADEMPELILRCMASNNVALCWFSALDEGFSNFDAIHRKAVELSELPQRNETAIRPLPTQFEVRRLSESLAKIAESDAEQNSARISALQAIVRVAPKFEDINYSDAVGLARYILDVTDKREKLEVERALPHFANWANLKLAIVDHFADSEEVSFSSLTDAYQRLNLEVRIDGSDRQTIQKTVLNAIANEIKQQRSDLITANKWDEIESRIYGLLKQRVAIVSDNAVTSNSECVNQLLDGVGAFRWQSIKVRDGSVARSASLIRDSDIPEMSKIAMANEILANAFGNLETANHQILESRLRSDGQLNYSQQLLASELYLMSILGTHRQKWLERIAR